MKPWLETVSIPASQSCLIYDRQLPEFGFNWHFHPEYELTLTLHSEGKRFVGGSVEEYTDGDLVLVGPNLPHAWQSQSTTNKGKMHQAVVCWFTQSWIEGLIQLMPEYSSLPSILSRASGGLVFDQGVSTDLRQTILSLTHISQAEKMLTLQRILLHLSTQKPSSSRVLNPERLPEPDYDKSRTASILFWLQQHYVEPIRLAPLCHHVHLSESQLQRIFKRSTGVSISHYVARLRIAKACSLLTESDLTMTDIAAQSGFFDSAHFSRSFSRTVGLSPTQYRKHHKDLVQHRPDRHAALSIQ
ncbi:helix-turn-helix domain-containing protein [Maribrevibacterium harenarium]|uniref:Helix-turn-helix domain-containing protein n=1 Tax=Maribrevibacterium harenarium TaxID=2589817 RepID=A0A501WUL7_9GAMM|nr:AraC family transcriptional regulator [Maribrevibacterium harenarium]TPE53433.1 helix-turn-helix domain-containing protein [Maribrevibacterium harenarium]